MNLLAVHIRDMRTRGFVKEVGTIPFFVFLTDFGQSPTLSTVHDSDTVNQSSSDCKLYPFYHDYHKQDRRTLFSCSPDLSCSRTVLRMVDTDTCECRERKEPYVLHNLPENVYSVQAKE